MDWQPIKTAPKNKLVLAADEIIWRRGVIDNIYRLHSWKEYQGQATEKAPWWRRIFRRRS